MINQLNVGDEYKIICQIQACTDEDKLYIGERGHCRYCGGTDPKNFRNIAHTFPQALGNKWVISKDECDTCNKLFSSYDDALSSALRSFLTLGGTLGKNGVPQTGRTKGNSVIGHYRNMNGRQIHVQLNNASAEDHVKTSADGKHFQFTIPVENFKFYPRNAYKALCKIGLAIAPLNLLGSYSKLLEWIRSPDEELEFPVLEVGLSFGSIGNAPPIVSAILLQRKVSTSPVPHLYLIFCAGSVCAQMALMSDSLDDHLPPTLMGKVSINWKVILGPKQEMTIDYGKVWHFNWSSLEKKAQPVESFLFDFDASTTAGFFTPRFRPTE